ncbi:Conserved_hypothetical protein [Hexamita inflata]|uniref:Cleavage/polyadenylation specificity factor A subunit C-terminal domain-containing protein n=1 Tax=Hexamita inflata TaxID=28002 RepID=A0ABP1HMB6_9EUKA
MLFRSDITSITALPAIINPCEHDCTISTLSDKTYTQWILSKLRQKKQSKINIDYVPECFVSIKNLLVTSFGQTIQLFNAPQELIKLDLGFKIEKIFAYLKTEQYTKVIQLNEQEQLDNGEIEELFQAEEIINELIVLEVCGQGIVQKIVINQDLVNSVFEVEQDDLEIDNPINILQSLEIEALDKCSYYEYDFKTIICAYQNLLIFFDRITKQIIQVIVTDIQEILYNKTLQFVKEKINQLINISNVSICDKFVAVQQTNSELHSTELIVLNPKSKTTLLTKIIIPNEFTQILFIEDTIYLFQQSYFAQLSLKSKIISNQQDFSDQILKTNNDIISVHQIKVQDNEHAFLIVHQNSFQIFQQNQLRMVRTTCGLLSQVLFKRDQIQKSDRNDLDLITINTQNSRLSMVDVRNQVLERDFSVEGIISRNLVKTAGNYIFFIKQNNNGDEYVQMHDYLKHQKVSQQFLIQQGRIAAQAHSQDIRKRFGAIDFHYELQKSERYNEMHYNEQKPADRVIDFQVSPDGGQIVLLSQFGISVYSTQSATLLYSNYEYNQFRAVGFVTKTGQQFSETQFSSAFQFQQMTEQQKFIACVSREGQLQLTSYLNKKLIVSCNFKEQLMKKLNAELVDMVSQEAESVQINDNQIIMSSINGLLVWQLQFNQLEAHIALLRQFDLQGSNIMIQNNKIVANNGNYFFSYNSTLYQFDLQFGQLFIIHQFDKNIESFDCYQNLFAISFKQQQGFKIYQRNELVQRKALNSVTAPIVHKQLQNQSKKGFELLQYLKTNKNNQFRADSQKMKKSDKFQFGTVSESAFIVEKDIVFLSVDEIIKTIKEVKSLNDQLYLIGILFMILKYKRDEIKSSDELREIIVKEINNNYETWKMLKEAGLTINALIELADAM